ncbi:Uncharacterised protein [uncultured archaeon]|nr:Uncharacterised protein [uncultured archaeon]
MNNLKFAAIIAALISLAMALPAMASEPTYTVVDKNVSNVFKNETFLNSTVQKILIDNDAPHWPKEEKEQIYEMISQTAHGQKVNTTDRTPRVMEVYKKLEDAAITFSGASAGITLPSTQIVTQTPTPKASGFEAIIAAAIVTVAAIIRRR